MVMSKIKTILTDTWMRTAAISLVLCVAGVLGSSLADGASASQNVPSSQVAAVGPALHDIAGHWGKETIEWAVSEHIVDGFEDGSFQPDKPVSESEFLTMLLKAYVGDSISEQRAGEAWYARYYRFASELQWPVDRSKADQPFLRGQVAVLLAAAQGKDMGETEAILLLLEQGLAQGKTADASVSGFAAMETLTRAEAVQFIRNMKGKVRYVTGLAASERIATVGGIALGDTEADVRESWGSPSRKDPSEYGFEWHIYNADYANYRQVGIRDGIVVALYTNSSNWRLKKGVLGADSTAADAVRVFGQPLQSITKGFTTYLLTNPGMEDGVYVLDDSYLTFYYDMQDEKRIEAILLIDETTEEAKSGYYGKTSDALREAFEWQVFDLANAARAKRGLPAFVWDDAAAGVARGHSKDMAERDYFDHLSPERKRFTDRFKAANIQYVSAAENIAAGQPNAIVAHSGWLNSTSGHRESLLGATTHLGVGVHFGGSMRVYYTQNFYTPRE